MIWLISVTFFFAFLDIYFAKLEMLQSITIGAVILIITGTLLRESTHSLKRAKQILIDKTEKDLQNGGFIRKWFLIVLFIEIFAMNLATVILLMTNHFEYIVPVNILIVSLHFIVLGRIFAMPIYYLLGIIVSAIVVATLFLVSSTSRFGNLITIAAIPSVCFIILNWITIIYVLHDSAKYFKE